VVFQQYQAGGEETSSLVSPLRQYVQLRYSHLQAVFDLDQGLADLAVATGSDEIAGAPIAGCVPPAPGTPSVTHTDGGGAVVDEEVERLLRESEATVVDAGASQAVPTTVDAGVRPSRGAGRH